MGHRKNNRGKRSEDSEKARRCLQNLYKFSTRYIWNTARRDYILSETICLTSKESVINELKKSCSNEIEYLHLDTIPTTSQLWPVPTYAENALILWDSRGQGAAQR